ncbi:MAG: hypothetical protein RRC34_12955 [Lentisphaeria bacterium]|nr:hypothetical protein [Lentisphaeria bacterium]
MNVSAENAAAGGTFAPSNGVIAADLGEIAGESGVWVRTAAAGAADAPTAKAVSENPQRGQQAMPGVHGRLHLGQFFIVDTKADNVAE